jgi:hypothetical protein
MKNVIPIEERDSHAMIHNGLKEHSVPMSTPNVFSAQSN